VRANVTEGKGGLGGEERKGDRTSAAQTGSEHGVPHLSPELITTCIADLQQLDLA
jgi:hypothetical protein